MVPVQQLYGASKKTSGSIFLSLVVPAYFEEKRIGKMLEETLDVILT
jgi:hypothetical protein